MRIALALALVLVAAAAGCGDDTVDEPAAPGIEHPAGADEVVVQVRRTGGFRPVGAGFADVPQATLLGDGTLIVEGAQIEIFPPPALPPLFRFELSDEQVQAVLREARAAGLLDEPPAYGEPPIADATTTVVELHAAGDTFVHEVYALAEADGLAGPQPGLTDDQRERRRRVAEFIGELSGPGGAFVDQPAAGEPYEAERYAIRATPVDGTGAEPEVPEGIEPEVVDWPVPDVALAEAATCTVVDGAGAEALGAVLREASTITRYRQDGRLFTLQVRPLLPNETSCDDLPGVTA